MNAEASQPGPLLVTGTAATPLTASAARAQVATARQQYEQPRHLQQEQQQQEQPQQQQEQPLASSSGRNGDEQLVLTPAKLRLDSRAMALHAITMWLGNMVFGVLLMCQLTGRLDTSWWLVFMPLWIGHAAHISTQAALIAAVDRQVYKQIGPPPPASGSMAMHMQYAMVRQLRRKTHIVDCASSAIDSVAVLAVKAVLCWLLADGSIGSPGVCWRLVFMPLWISWVLTTIATSCKDAPERVFGQLRDLLYIFAVFLAFKLDGLADYSWQVVFLVPWMWFGALLITALLVAGMLTAARAWIQPHEMVLPAGFGVLLISAAVQLPACMYLVRHLNGDASISIEQILLPVIISWGAMGLTGLCLAWGLVIKERVRADLVARGMVWTLREDIAAQMTTDRDAAHQAVRALSDEQVAVLVQQLMQGKTKPVQLLKVGSTLYRRMASFTQSPGVTALVTQVTTQAAIAGAAAAAAVAGDGLLHVPAQQQDCPLAASKVGSSGLCVGGRHSSEEEGSTIRAGPRVELHRHAADTQEELHLGLDISDADEAAEQDAMSFVEVRVICRSPMPALAHHTHSPATTTPPTDPSSCQAATASCKAPAGSLLVRKASLALSDGDSATCCICYEGAATCVLLECGHGGFCRRCANLLFVRPPNECPQCRCKIEQIVEIEDAGATKVGQMARIIQ